MLSFKHEDLWKVWMDSTGGALKGSLISYEINTINLIWCRPI